MERKRAAFLLPAASLMLALVSAAGFFLARGFWPADLVNFFRPHIAVAGAAAALLLVPGRRPARLALAAAVFAATVLPQTILPRPAEPAGGATLRIMSANLMIENPDVSGLVRYIEMVKPDIVVTQETVDATQDALRQAAGLAYESERDLHSRNDMKLLSRYPILSEEAVRMPQEYPRLIRHPVRFTLQAPGSTIVLYAVHPDTPRTSWQWRQRNMYLALLEDAIRREPPDTRIVVAGDWNTPSWSPYFRDLIARAGLRTAESGWWPAPTRFSTRVGSIVALGMTIDHIAVSPGIGANARWTGPKYGSNHVPVIADLVILPR